MREYITGDFLYIDCDTIIADDLSDIENAPYDLGAVLEYHLSFNELPNKDMIIPSLEYLGYSRPQKEYFNGGLLFSKDTRLSHDFFAEWHKLWGECKSKGLSKDMPALNQANHNLHNCIGELEGIWNCQILAGGLQYLDDAKIIHYFSSNKQKNPYLLGNDSVYKEIKESGINQEIKAGIISCKKQFSKNVKIMTDPDLLGIIHSMLFIFILKNKRMYFIVNKLMTKIWKVIKLIHNKAG
jgi:lipopolysaccharide biosynthesis glycosyltransferase